MSIRKEYYKEAKRLGFKSKPMRHYISFLLLLNDYWPVLADKLKKRFLVRDFR